MTNKKLLSGIKYVNEIPAITRNRQVNALHEYLKRLKPDQIVELDYAQLGYKNATSLYTTLHQILQTDMIGVVKMRKGKVYYQSWRNSKFV